MNQQSPSHEQRVLRDSIKKTARQFFTSKGYDRTSLQEILTELQISRTTFHGIFASKGALLEAIWSE